MEIINLSHSDYDEALALLNYVFTIENKREMDFEAEMPKIFKKGKDTINNHYGIKEDGKLVALLGIYPFTVTIMDEKFSFATVGNVATHPGYTGRGYMKHLMIFAMAELQKRGYDASRLGGIRHRYNRYGYEKCGTKYSFVVGNSARAKSNFKHDNITFKRLSLDNEKELEYCSDLNKKSGFYIQREMPDGTSSVYEALSTWRCVPYVAYSKDNYPIGYICTMSDESTICEIRAETLKGYKDIIFSYQEKIGNDVSFWLPPFETDAVRYFYSVSNDYSGSYPSSFKIINFEGVTNALMKLKFHHSKNLSKGSFVLGIEGYGAIELFSDGKAFGCKKTSKEPSISLDSLDAQRFLFGPMMPETVGDTNPFLSSWLPLMLSWSPLDSM